LTTGKGVLRMGSLHDGPVRDPTLPPVATRTAWRHDVELDFGLSTAMPLAAGVAGQWHGHANRAEPSCSCQPKMSLSRPVRLTREE
jgi:hypothetical protein